MNLPNFLTLIRILSVPIFIIFLFYKKYHLSLIILLLSSMSDALDGFIARYFHQKTTLGTYLDPLADKLLFITSYITLSILKIIPTWLTIIVISRDILILIGVLVFFIFSYPLEIKPTKVSKLTTFFQFITLFLSLLYVDSGLDYILLQIIYVITAIFTIISGLHYFYKGTKIIDSVS